MRPATHLLPAWKNRVPEHRGRTTVGRVTDLSHGRFCGMIVAADSRRVFFHGRDLEGARYNDVNIGAQVTFELIEDRVSGPRAARVRLVGAAKAAG